MTIKRNVFASWLSHGLTLVIGLFLVRYVKETLGDTGYGAWIFVSSIAGYSGLLYMGFGAAVCRYSARYYTLQDWPGLNRILSSIFAIYVVNSLIAIFGAAICALFADRISDWEGQSLTEVRQVLLMLGLNAAIGLWGSVYSGLLVGLQRFDIQRGLIILCTLVRTAIVVIGLNWHPSLVVMAGSFLAVTLLENLTYFLAARRLVPQLHVAWRFVSREAFKECYGFTAFNALGMLSDYLISLTDTVVIGVMLGTAATVPYYIAQRLCQMARAPLEQLAEVMMPRAGELQIRQELHRLRSMVLQGTGLSLLLIGGFAIGCAFFADQLLMIWLGAGNEASPPILMVLLAAQVIALPLRVPKMTLMGMGDIRTPALFDVVQATANLVLSLIFVQNFGVIGVAYGTLLPAICCELGLLLPYTCRRLGLPVRDLVVESVLPQIPSFAALWVYCELVSRLPVAASWLSLIGIAAGGGAVLLAIRGGIYWLAKRQAAAIAPPQEMVTT
ncbi:MAG: lipopolysaccharide biosynthesis protein [Planctomycetaceae bacterium]